MGIGAQIRKIRTQQQLTVKKLSELSKVPEKTIYRIETGEVKDPKISSVEPIIKALNCSADEVIFDINEFTKLGELRQAFAYASKLTESDQEMLIRFINMLSMASNIENQISKSKFVKIKENEI